MSYGLPYDSDEGRALAGAITAIMTGHAYEQSAEIASVMGPFKGYRDARCAHVSKPLAKDNVESMLGVINSIATPSRHSSQQRIRLPQGRGPRNAGTAPWSAAAGNGYRNAQVTVLAPTGTIAFLMDCDTTGVEPDIALVKYKLLAGGGMLKMVNRGVPTPCAAWATPRPEIAAIAAHVEKFDTIEDVAGKRRDHPQRPESPSICRCSIAPSRPIAASAASATWPISR
jgi:ribonucleoside-diphosphate reductase alpha chain